MTPDPALKFCWRCATALAGPPPIRCIGCGQDHYNNPRPAAEAVVIQERQVLVIRRARDPWKDCWDIPGGFMEPGEDPRTTAERELEEETGLQASATELLGIWTDLYGAPDPDGMQITTLNIAYQMTLRSEERSDQTDDEAQETGWVSLDAPPDNLAFPRHAYAVLQAARGVV